MNLYIYCSELTFIRIILFEQFKMKRLIFFFLIILIPQFMDSQAYKTFHDFIVKSIDGQMYALSQLKGKKVLVVNTASKCGFTQN